MGLPINFSGLGWVKAWKRGPVVLAWDEVLAGGRDPRDGHNVVYHEFAHQLDFQGKWPHRASTSGSCCSKRRTRSAGCQCG